MKTIQLTKGLTAIVDDADYDWLVKYKWCASKPRHTYYAQSRMGGNLIYMHRLIMGNPDGKIDHENRDGLDNRRSNLRLATSSQNAINSRLSRTNTSGHRGVSWSKVAAKWEAYVWKDRKKIYLGLFDDADSASQARNLAAMNLHGEFAG